MNSPQPYLTVASILTGFSISVFMFRIQRELGVRDRHPDWPNWLAWADYLIIATIVLSVVLVIIPLVAVPTPSRTSFSVAAASCAARSCNTTCLIGSPPAQQGPPHAGSAKSCSVAFSIP